MATTVRGEGKKDGGNWPKFSVMRLPQTTAFSLSVNCKANGPTRTMYPLRDQHGGCRALNMKRRLQC